MPSKNFPSKSVPDVVSKPRESTKNIELKREQFFNNPDNQKVPPKPYTSFQDFNEKIALLKLHSFKVEYLPTGNFTRDERAKMFIARPTYEGIRIFKTLLKIIFQCNELVAVAKIIHLYMTLGTMTI